MVDGRDDVQRESNHVRDSKSVKEVKLEKGLALVSLTEKIIVLVKHKFNKRNMK